MGEEAERLGLAERCVDGEDLLDEAKAFIQGLADSVALSSIYTIKKQLYRGLQTDFGSAFDESLSYTVGVFYAKVSKN